MQSLADAMDAGDADAFTTAVAEFDSLTRLDAWKTALLVRAGGRGEGLEHACAGRPLACAGLPSSRRMHAAGGRVGPGSAHVGGAAA